MATAGRNQTAVEAYQTYMVPTEFEPWSTELLSRMSLRPDDSVLDVACGTGVVARGAARLVGPSGAVKGVDPNPAMLQMARALPPPNGTPVEWVQARAEDLPFDEASFDAVLSQQGIQFFADRAAAVREMHRVLKPGGQVGASVWRGAEHQSVKGALVRALQEMFGDAAGVAYSFGSTDDLQQLFIDARFRDVHIESVRRQMHEPDPDRMVRMLVMGASAAVPALAAAGAEEREVAMRSIRERIDADIEAARVPDGIRYTMEANILVATA